MRLIAVTVAAMGAALLAAAGAGAAPASDTVMVRIAPGSEPAERAAIAQRLDAGEAHTLPGGWRAYRVDDPLTAVEARRALAGLPAERIEVDRRVTPTAADTYRRLQLHLDRIGAPGAWSVGPGAPVTVAVIDTAIAIDHPDLVNRRWVNADERDGTPGVDDDENGYVDDVHGINLVDDAAGDGAVAGDGSPASAAHGTHVAGLIAAERDNGWAVAGVSDNARIMGVRFMSGDSPGGALSDGILGIQYAVASGARVINLSWGLPPGQTSAALCDAIASANASGVLVVAAAGNDGVDIDGARRVVPAACPATGLLTVGATDAATDTPATFSNTGRRSVDLAAPGTQPAVADGTEGLVSLYSDGALDRAAAMRGTSMAAPVAAGAAATILGHRPELTPAQVIALLRTRGVALADLAPTTLSGRRLDLQAALTSARALGAREPVPVITAQAPAHDAVVATAPEFSWSASGGDPIEYRLVVDGTPVRVMPGAARRAQMPELAEGIHTWRVESTAGVAATPTRTITLDATAPAPFTIRVETVADRVRLSWDAPTDALSGVASVTVERAGAPIATLGPGAGTHDAGPLPPAGSVEALAVAATDRAGNTRRMSIHVAMTGSPGVAPASAAAPAPATVPAARAARARVVRLRVGPRSYPRRYEVRARTASRTRVIARGRLAPGVRVVRVRLSASLAAQSPVLRVRTTRMRSTARTRVVRVRPAATARTYTVTARVLSRSRVVARGSVGAGARSIRVRLPRAVAAEGPHLAVRLHAAERQSLASGGSD